MIEDFAVTSISTLGNNPLSLLWALQQRYAHGTAAASGAPGTSSSASPSPSSSSALSSGTPQNNGVTGGSSAALNPNSLFIFISMQEQQSAPQSTASQAGTTGSSNAAQSLFNSIDADGDGVISQAELEKAVTAAGGTTAQADALFNKISGGNGSIGENQLASALQKADGHHHHHHLGGTGGTAEGSDGGAGSGDPLSALMGGQTADGANSQVTTNADGSTTTTLTYADGTTLTLTEPAGSGGSASASPGGPAATGALQNQQNMEQLLSMLVKLQTSMAQPSQIAAVAA
ncbi:MAG TPA: EF-hand domain-containing protein [Alphaproteobacteria bacterium]|nr:EF-hand domain-containing protein [Alphaproteobacteria bacterium]